MPYFNGGLSWPIFPDSPWGYKRNKGERDVLYDAYDAAPSQDVFH